MEVKNKEVFKAIIQEQKIRLGPLQLDTPEKQIEDILHRISRVQQLIITLNYDVFPETFTILLDLGLQLIKTVVKSGNETRYDFKFL